MTRAQDPSPEDEPAQEPSGPFGDHPRTQISNHPNVGTGPGAGGKCLFLFGIPFLGAGLLVLAGTLGAVELQGTQAPPWVMGAFGSVFGIVGLGLMIAGARSVLREKQLTKQLGDYLDEPWRFDGWDRQFAPDLLGGVLAPFGVALFMTLFLTPFNYFVFVKDGGEPIFVQAMIGLFDAFALAAFGHAFYRLGRRLKYRDGKLRYPQLPLLTREPVRLTLRFPRALEGKFQELTCTFRAAEQQWEQRGDSKSLITYEVYREERVFSGHELHRELPLEFELPKGAPGTELHGEVVRFYTLEVQAETPGIDYRALYLVPIYR